MNIEMQTGGFVPMIPPLVLLRWAKSIDVAAEDPIVHQLRSLLAEYFDACETHSELAKRMPSWTVAMALNLCLTRRITRPSEQARAIQAAELRDAICFGVCRN